MSHIDKKIFLTFLLTPYLYTFSLYENPSFIIVSAETEYGIYLDKILVSENKLFKRSNNSPGPVACFSDKE